MISEKNLDRNGYLNFEGKLDTMNCIVSNLFRKFRDSWDDRTAHEVFKSFNELEERNIIIPIELIRNIGRFEKDTSGCRIYNWKLLSTPQIKKAMNLSGRYNRVIVPHTPLSSFLAHTSVGESGNIPTMPIYEQYDKFLNITYLVNDEFMTDWLNPHYNEPNVAEKGVKDCSVSELLFAIKKKLSNQDENGEKL